MLLMLTLLLWKVEADAHDTACCCTLQKACSPDAGFGLSRVRAYGVHVVLNLGWVAGFIDLQGFKHWFNRRAVIGSVSLSVVTLRFKIAQKP